ncbi:MAG: nicotinate phosphoribosyltransferase [Betaproteobacteria bacterium]|nr:nicotinate phosphoribosyltransferase [Betaproteobacteria bacterium]
MHGDARFPQGAPFSTDLYELTMLQAYLDEGLQEMAVFELFVRKLPAKRNFLVAAGLESVLQFLETLRFGPDALEWLAATGRFKASLIDYLAEFRFSGDVHALPEGCVFFPDEPIVRITAPLPMAQLVETQVMNRLHYQSLVASKAARIVLAAQGAQLVDFGLRRAHGEDAGLAGARAAFLAGFAGSSNVAAERLFGIPAFGTMAHSFIQAHDDEAAAFRSFAAAQPERCVLLIDTYDTEAAARKVAALAQTLAATGTAIRSVRIDSGDLAAHARNVRAILDEAGCPDIGVFASGNLDEYEIERLLAGGAPIRGFGVGTRLLTSADAPYLDCAYKLEEYGGRPRRKRSEGKATWPGRKQVYRHVDGGRMDHDCVTLDGDVRAGRPLLEPCMQAGRRVGPAPTLAESRALAARELAMLPDHLRGLGEGAVPYRVEISPALADLAAAFDRRNA